MANEVETIIDSVSLSASGGSDTGSFRNRRRPTVVRVNGDANSGSIDVELTGGTLVDGNPVSLAPTVSETGVDATSDVVIDFAEAEGFDNVQFTVTNQGASTSTVTVKAVEY